MKHRFTTFEKKKKKREKIPHSAENDSKLAKKIDKRLFRALLHQWELLRICRPINLRVISVGKMARADRVRMVRMVSVIKLPPPR